MPVKFGDLLNAYMFVNIDDEIQENSAFLCKQTGQIYWYSDLMDLELDELPDDIEDSEKYLPIPDRREFDLGKPLALNFADQFLTDDFEDVRDYFGSKGAFSRFKNLLARRGKLEQWYEFQNKAEETALREWCEENSVELAD